MSGIAGALFLALASNAALAEKRVALIVGNSAYRNVAELPNPEKDAASVAKLFRDAGFDTVVAENNLGNLEFKRAIRKFEDATVDADIAVVFYAGHGIEIGGVNYLIPVDAKLVSDRDAQDEAISLDRLISSVESAKRLHLIILDACRDNPFGKKIKRMIASRSITPGLGKVEPAGTDTLIAYAAKAGSTAEDGDGSHSPFTTALLANLTAPGLDIRLAFGRVRDQVMKITNRRQEPFVYGSLGGTTVSLVPAPQRVEPVALSVENIVRDYQFAERIGTRGAWESFMVAHTSGFYYNLAKAARDKVAAAEDKFKRDEDAQLKAAAEEAKRHAEVETKTHAAEDARLKAAAQARIKAETEARRKADADAKMTAEAEAKRKAEAEEKLKAEIGVRRKAELDAKLQAEVDAKRKADEESRLRAELDAKAAEPGKSAPPTVIALAPAQPAIEPVHEPKRAIDPANLASLLQFQLKRVGCDPGTIDGTWNDRTGRAMAQFNTSAHTNFDVKVASLDALEVVKEHKARVCPLVCEKGYRAKQDRCVETVCKHGLVRNHEGECIRDTKTAARPSAGSAASDAGAQVFCGRGGCRTIPKNCRIAQFRQVGGRNVVCN